MTQKTPASGKVGKARILIVDDHPVSRTGLTQLVQSERDLEVCGEADNAIDGMKAVAELTPDLVVVDLTLDEGMEGLELIKDMLARFPEMRTLVVSMHDESVFAERAIRAGARGYVMKEMAMDTILDAIRQVLKGEVYLSETMSKRLLQTFVSGKKATDKLPIERLTDRELEVFQLIGQGLSPSEIADKLCISVKTVETYRAHMKEKLQLDDASELLRYAIRWTKSEKMI